MRRRSSKRYGAGLGRLPQGNCLFSDVTVPTNSSAGVEVPYRFWSLQLSGDRTVAVSVSDTRPRLRRVLHLRDLVLYGIVIITPIAPVPIFGLAETRSHGHAALTVVFAGMAMMLTAVSYGRMAALSPSAGSAYTYVGRSLNPHLGFMAGWAMLLDYLILPVVAVIQAALAMERILPAVPYAVWVTLFVALMTGLNCRGIRTTAQTNIWLVVVMSVVIGAFLIEAIRYLFLNRGVSFLHPLFAPANFDLRAVAAATSLSALTYIGFDGVTTLAEEVENPRRNIPLATLLVCLLTLVSSFILVYLAQLVWPDYRSYSNIETAFMDVTERVGGLLLFQAMGFLVMLSSFGGGLAGQVAAARLLFGMGRDNVLPRRVFGYMHPVLQGPTLNVILIGVLALAGSLVGNLEQTATLLNFGAFVSFMGVNLAAIREAFRTAGGQPFLKSLAPAGGFLFCLGIWISLPPLAKTVGGLWFLTGLVYDVVRSRGFRHGPVSIDFSEGAPERSVSE